MVRLLAAGFPGEGCDELFLPSCTGMQAAMIYHHRACTRNKSLNGDVRVAISCKYALHIH